MKTIQLKKRSLLHSLWALTYRVFDVPVPTTTTTCAVWRRVIFLVPIMAGAALAYLVFGIYIVIQLSRGNCRFSKSSGKSLELQDRRYSGLPLGRFEIYPFHGVVVFLIGLDLWCVWQTIAHWNNSKGLPEWVGVVGVLSIMGLAAGGMILAVALVSLIIVSLQRSRPWLSSFFNHWCAKVEVVE